LGSTNPYVLEPGHQALFCTSFHLPTQTFRSATLATPIVNSSLVRNMALVQGTTTQVDGPTELCLCGDGHCGEGETLESCPEDCQSLRCGDGRCDYPAETQFSCSPDCLSECGNGICDLTDTLATCPSDCSSCGDGYCVGNEDIFFCPTDCSAGGTHVWTWNEGQGQSPVTFDIPPVDFILAVRVVNETNQPEYDSSGVAICVCGI